MAAYIIVAMIAYFIGSVNFSVILSKKIAGFDVREKGSGNAGTTNMLRTVGKGAAALTLVCDILKGVVSIAVALLVGKMSNSFGWNLDNSLLIQLAGIFVIVGHTFPVFFGFKGGKGVATSLGVLLMTNWQIGLICLVFAVVLIAMTRMVSIGSIAAAILFPVLVACLDQNFIVPASHWHYFAYSIIIGAFVVFNHRTNLKRILTGKENKLSFKK